MDNRSFITFCNSMMIAKEGFIIKALQKRAKNKNKARNQENTELQKELDMNGVQKDFETGMKMTDKYAKLFMAEYMKADPGNKLTIDPDETGVRGVGKDREYSVFIGASRDFDNEIMHKVLADFTKKYSSDLTKYYINIIGDMSWPDYKYFTIHMLDYIQKKEWSEYDIVI